MVTYIIRQVKRFAILIPGFIIAYFAVRNIYPHLDHRLPASLAILVTYILAAYVLIPTALRLVRIVFPSRHLPLYCVTPDGFASDPLNIGIVGTREELKAAMAATGWYPTEPHTVRNVSREIISTLMNWPYPTAPVSGLYLLGRKQDIAFQIPLDIGRGARHHVRFWATKLDAKYMISRRTVHWHNKLDELAPDERILWIGAASLDIGLAPIRHNFQLTHMIHPNTNQERSLIIQRLDAAGLMTNKEAVELTDKPYKLTNRAWRGYLESDGKMIVIWLGSSKQQKAVSQPQPARSSAKH
jgi:hypothetical protein